MCPIALRESGVPVTSAPWRSVQVPVMDKAGRRPLLLYPMAMMIVVLGVMTTSLNLKVSPRQGHEAERIKTFSIRDIVLNCALENIL